jgi:hypothetical protein
VSGDGYVVGFLKEGGSEVGGDVETMVMGGVEEVIDDGEVVSFALLNLPECGLV